MTQRARQNVGCEERETGRMSCRQLPFLTELSLNGFLRFRSLLPGKSTVGEVIRWKRYICIVYKIQTHKTRSLALHLDAVELRLLMRGSARRRPPSASVVCGRYYGSLRQVRPASCTRTPPPRVKYDTTSGIVDRNSLKHRRLRPFYSGSNGPAVRVHHLLLGAQP